ncbi:MAG: hypothetical protein ACKO4A_10175, partial [Gammaproteobacteria bacterium]
MARPPEAEPHAGLLDSSITGLLAMPVQTAKVSGALDAHTARKIQSGRYFLATVPLRQHTQGIRPMSTITRKTFCRYCHAY